KALPGDRAGAGGIRTCGLVLRLRQHGSSSRLAFGSESPSSGEKPMKALVYHGPGKKSWDTVADPKPVEPTDIVVKVDTTTICGTDLHILKGDVPTVEPGRIL